MLLFDSRAQQQPQPSSHQYFSPQCRTPGKWEGGKIQRRGKKAKREDGGDSSDLMTFREDAHLMSISVLPRFAVIVTAVRVTICYSDSFLLSKKDLCKLKFFGYSDTEF